MIREERLWGLHERDHQKGTTKGLDWGSLKKEAEIKADLCRHRGRSSIKHGLQGLGGDGGPREEVSERGRDGMGGVRRVPERCESPKGLEQEGIAECESDPQRDDFEGLGDVATSLTMEVIVRRIREVEKLKLIRFGKRRDGGVGDAVGAEEALPRLRREIKPMENLGEEENLKVRSKWRSIVVAHAVEKTVAERNWELGSGDQGRVLGVRHT